ncbi:hypothetical protein CAOG_009771 [Capsaspora owczarzaki ATCC 30864]|uniref:ATP-dependent RNA helicase n=1 Tax=Capsaspora owczarzaki (strain ATCC 30864) TaxID=595528 RepID=A0A0D2WRB0_CAPO3|nr:hypothetical protein CAOG_009771 [Capsaspora owczarzaki ATCC 30864]
MAAATSGAALTDAAANAGSWSSVRPGLSSATRVLLEEHLGFTQMTPVQAAVLPLFLANKDVAVEAVTGSGKTLSFVVPILEILLAARRSDRGSSSSNAIMPSCMRATAAAAAAAAAAAVSGRHATSAPSSSPPRGSLPSRSTTSSTCSALRVPVLKTASKRLASSRQVQELQRPRARWTSWTIQIQSLIQIQWIKCRWNSACSCDRGS